MHITAQTTSHTIGTDSSRSAVPPVTDATDAAGSSRIDVGVELAYDLELPTTFVFAVHGARTEHQRIVDEVLTLDPSGDARVVHADDERRLVRASTDSPRFSLAYRATFDLVPHSNRPERLDERAADEIPTDVLPFLAPSRYCESDRLGRFAEARFSDSGLGYRRVQAVSDWVGAALEYVPGASDASTTATDALVAGAGVCRDFAHLSIALCRALGIPARYVSGYGIGVDPPDFHGFFEAYVGRRWYLFDPTGMAPNDGLVRIAAGRDAADVAFADLHGEAELVTKNVTVVRVAPLRTESTPTSGDAPASTA